jgi:hypothetical protein
MAKKIIPNGNGNGYFCIGNFTLFIIIILLAFILFYLYRISIIQNITSNNNNNKYTILPHLGNNNNNNSDPLTNPYIPPLRNDNDINRRPITIATQSVDMEYKQIGILTRGDKEILPLMGRRKMTSKYKWQYYTIIGGGNGNLQTKLPVSVNGKSCTGEYGCDEIYNNDTVYVEGYKDIFVATIYENNSFEYVL